QQDQSNSPSCFCHTNERYQDEETPSPSPSLPPHSNSPLQSHNLRYPNNPPKINLVTVTISWSNIDSPSKLDWLGLYPPPDSLNEHSTGYKFQSSSPSWQSGSGSISLPITVFCGHILLSLALFT
ncbi:hypothetical protein NC652_021068, partial [Populus alba x Populus x berolinensis]